MPEYFDLLDREGRPLGMAKERALVHRDGDWHRSIQLWIVRHDGRLVFQQRSSNKDTWPDRLTATVSGHYAAGESLDAVLREAHEEIGLQVSVADLLPLGCWRSDDRPSPEITDRELQDVFFWPLDLPLSALRPNPGEVSALCDVPPAQLLALLNGQLAQLRVEWMPQGTTTVTTRLLAPGDLVPAAEYHKRIASAALTFASGRPPTLGI